MQIDHLSQYFSNGFSIENGQQVHVPLVTFEEWMERPDVRDSWIKSTQDGFDKNMKYLDGATAHYQAMQDMMPRWIKQDYERLVKAQSNLAQAQTPEDRAVYQLHVDTAQKELDHLYDVQQKMKDPNYKIEWMEQQDYFDNVAQFLPDKSSEQVKQTYLDGGDLRKGFNALEALLTSEVFLPGKAPVLPPPIVWTGASSKHANIGHPA
ncbi:MULTISPECIES: hypothetical protein [unclassified Pseudovibrio]|uniref:hypothetical protein n=1 Tax=unclassified Pseudovibrio TaxID=2627060 RepID=UPI0007AED394|nr:MULTISPECIES: hypothetical protein [unclassified Pseudovibrio]KZK95078.1 hypothetical protein PsW74_04340 [Pseudovibrio sp. W74]KZL08881.1 hypothetical protein PsAD14_02826 [Pseudovibrio sp. Ad14]